MRIAITATPQCWSDQNKSNWRHVDLATVQYADEIKDQGQIGVRVGMAVMQAIDNMRKSGLDACDPHWSILLTIRRVEREDENPLVS